MGGYGIRPYAVTIPGKIRWVTITDQPGAHWERTFPSATAETIPSGTLWCNEYRPTEHALSPGTARLAAAAVVITAAAVVVITAYGVAAAVAQQQDQDDDPANVTATETIVIPHNKYLRENIAAKPLIPRYSAAPKRCVGKIFC